MAKAFNFEPLPRSGFRYYIVKPSGEIVGTDDIMEWGNWCDSAPTTPDGKPFLKGGRRAAWTDLENGDAVSTVFLGLDHAFGGGPPVLFETMIRRKGSWEDQWRYHTYEEALAGHEHAIKVARGEVKEEDI